MNTKIDYPLIILALDPGVTTGHAVGTIDHPGAVMQIRQGQNRFDQLEMYLQMELLKPRYVVAEDFEYRLPRRKGLQVYKPEFLFPVQLIGIYHLWCMLNKIPLYMQKAMEGKSYYTDALLKKNGVYIPGKPHAMDATRHLLHWYTFGHGYQYNVSGFEKAGKVKGR